MKVPYTWLQEYVDITLDPEKLASILTMAGLNVASCEKIGGDYIFEFEITANRSDCLSILGIAREVAAIFNKKLKIPKSLKAVLPSDGRGKLPIDISIEDKDLCYRYSARILKNIEVRPSPDWLKEKIIAVGLRPVNNVVDITNFILLETGQPMHAFDLDKIRGSVCVRRAKKDEQIITIDKASRTCDSDILVIADKNGPIAIAGIMGGLETEVNNMTKNMLLESAFFDPISIRRTSRALGLSSESSYRFERRIDNSMVLKASNRASSLIKEIAGGEMGGLSDTGNKKVYSKDIALDIERANSVLGISVSKNNASNILKKLGFGVKNIGENLRVTVPSFREDVKTDIDITEEIARIYGYEKIPLTIPHIVGNVKIKDYTDILQEKIAATLVRFGLKEIITYSLTSKGCIKNLDIPEEMIIVIKNPLSIDQEIMRPTLLPGMLGVVSYNLNRKAKGLPLFEIGKVYKTLGNSYTEEDVVSIGLTGIKREDWKSRREEFDLFDIKGIFEKLLSDIGIKNITFKKKETRGLKQNTATVAEKDGEIIGSFGEVTDSVRGAFDINKNIFYGEIYINKIIRKTILDKKYVPLGQYPSIMRDISIIIGREVTSEAVTAIIENTGKGLVKNIFLVDRYKGKQIPEDKQGLLYRIEYRSDEKTLEDSEVNKLHQNIKDNLAGKLNVSFR